MIGPRTYRYWLADVAKVAKVSLSVVKKASWKREFDPKDFVSTVEWVMKKRNRKTEDIG